MPMNIALVGSNFALRGYLPAIEKINNYKIKIICSRNIKNFIKSMKWCYKVDYYYNKRNITFVAA